MTPKFSPHAQVLINACQALRELDGFEITAGFPAIAALSAKLTDDEQGLFVWDNTDRNNYKITLK